MARPITPRKHSPSRALWLSYLAVISHLQLNAPALCLALIQHLLLLPKIPALIELNLLIVATTLAIAIEDSRSYLRAADAHESMARSAFSEKGILTRQIERYLDLLRDEIDAMKVVQRAREASVSELARDGHIRNEVKDTSSKVHYPVTPLSNRPSPKKMLNARERRKSPAEDIRNQIDETPKVFESSAVTPIPAMGTSSEMSFEEFMEESRRRGKRSTLSFAKELWDQFRTPKSKRRTSQRVPQVRAH